MSYSCYCCNCRGIKCLLNHPGHSHPLPFFGWEMFCEHANEVPNICPCGEACGCKLTHCRGK